MPMALRNVSPLGHEDWVILVEKLKKGPSPKQAKAEDALRATKHLDVPPKDL